MYYFVISKLQSIPQKKIQLPYIFFQTLKNFADIVPTSVASQDLGNCKVAQTILKKCKLSQNFA